MPTYDHDNSDGRDDDHNHGKHKGRKDVKKMGILKNKFLFMEAHWH